MSERKSINKYYPPDFDPSKIVKKKKKVKTGAASLPTVRLMTPFSMKCDSCHEYISKSRKFNARKESTDESYLGMKIVRFHIKCPSCASEILFRTDPKSASFVIEFGAKKNYDSTNTNQQWKDETVDDILEKLEKEEEEVKLKEAQKDKNTTSLEELERKMNDLKRQQELNEEIDDLREKNSSFNNSIINTDLKKEFNLRLKEAKRERERQQDEYDDKLADAIFKKRKLPISDSLMNSDNHLTEKVLEPLKLNPKQSEDTSSSDSDSNLECEQPVVLLPTPKPAIPTKITINKRKTNSLGVSFKRLKK